jgi:hypothetical protein
MQVGNRALPINSSFLVDTTAPSFDNLTYPWATNAQNVTLSFDVTDGAVGSGVQDVKCKLRPQKLAVNDTSASQGSDWRACRSPEVFTSLQEGRWSLQLQATDVAQNVKITRHALHSISAE